LKILPSYSAQKKFKKKLFPKSGWDSMYWWMMFSSTW